MTPAGAAPSVERMAATSAAPPVSSARPSHRGTARAFIGDARLAATAANQLRLMALRRVFGASPAEANALTFVLALTAADASLRTARRVSRLAVPSPADAAIGGFLMRDAALGVAGPAARDFRFVGSLLAAAMLAGVALPGLRRAGVSLRDAERRVREQRIRTYAAAGRASRPAA
jgi:hypothetical protein